ncbi:MAG: phosphoribosylamine--glycine ligase [Chloroflexi bacterium]|nr:phosphoribosylamine--glycine ligase [Chloroflexota bacterium]
MEVLVLGSGAREHALAWRLARDEAVERVRIAPGNGGTPAVAETIPGLDILDPAAVARHAARERYGLVVVGPEAPLAAGVADALRQASVPVFGPARAAARLESSKAFAKEQLRRADVPTPACVVFDDVGEALAHARASDAPPVVKADWLAAGKGVVVPDSHEAAAEAIRELLANAPQGARVLLEERVTGREVSVFALVSDEAVVPLGAACDYKRLRDGDEGPNTGGMGAYAPVPWYGTAEVEQAVASIFEPIAWRMARDGTPYRGVLYAGLMLTEAGPMVLEFNARFGDPEAQALIPLLQGDLSQALLAAATGDLAAMEGAVALDSHAAVAVVIAAEGYPSEPISGPQIVGADPSSVADGGPLLCFHAGTRRTADGSFLSAGGRVVTYVGIGADLASARETAYGGAAGCELDGGQHRTDIALREL